MVHQLFTRAEPRFRGGERQTRTVDPKEERRAISEVTDRLIRRFPQVPDSQVMGVVDESYHELDGAPIRSFVGILVEKQAADRLASAAG